MKNLEEQPRAGKEEGNKIPCVLTHSRIPQPASVLPRPPDTGHKVPTARNSARRVRTSRMELQVNGTADEPARLTRCCFQVEQTRMRKMSVYKRKNRLLIPVCLISTLAQRFRREENRFTTFVCSAPVFLKSFITKAKPHCPVSLQRGAQSPAAIVQAALCPGWEEPRTPGPQALPAGRFSFLAPHCHQSTSYTNRRGIPEHHNHIFLGLSQPGRQERLWTCGSSLLPFSTPCHA